MPSPGFVAKVRAQTWYPGMYQQMQAAGVPEYLWISIIESEDSALDVGLVHPDVYFDGTPAGDSYGLFQLNKNPQGTDVLYAGNWAATRLGAALKQAGTYTPAQALAISEQVAWPGAASIPAAQVTERTANLNDVLSQMGWNATSTGTNAATVSQVGAVTTSQPNLLQQVQTTVGNAISNAGAIVGGIPSAVNAGVNNVLGITAAQDNFESAVNAITGTIASATNSAESWIPSIETNIFIGAAILACIAGGFAILTTSGEK